MATATFATTAETAWAAARLVSRKDRASCPAFLGVEAGRATVCLLPLVLIGDILSPGASRRGIAEPLAHGTPGRPVTRVAERPRPAEETLLKPVPPFSRNVAVASRVFAHGAAKNLESAGVLWRRCHNQRVDPGSLGFGGRTTTGPASVSHNTLFAGQRLDSQAARGVLRNVPGRFFCSRLLVEHRHGLKGLALQHLKRRPTAGRHVADLVGIAQLLNRCR